MEHTEGLLASCNAVVRLNCRWQNGGFQDHPQLLLIVSCNLWSQVAVADPTRGFTGRESRVPSTPVGAMAAGRLEGVLHYREVCLKYILLSLY